MKEYQTEKMIFSFIAFLSFSRDKIGIFIALSR